MDDRTLDSLRAALAATPGNLDLLRVVLEELVERGETAEALALLGERGPADLAREEDRLLAGRLCLAAGDAERALAWAAGESGEALLLQARCYLALERRSEGLAAYRAAVAAANPTLEDVNLRSLLGAVVHTFPGRVERPRLKVVANDDTAGEEVARLLTPAQERVTFADVGGLEDVKREIRRRIVLPFQKPSLFQRFRRRPGGGILLYGPPGCGKTLLARATAGECEASFLSVAISDVLDMYIGESERKLHALFEQARTKTPAVLFFDELEGLGGKRQFTREATSAKLVSQFLSEMDGFVQGNAGVLVLAATNVPWAIDPAFRRPGRFDRVLFVPPPDRPAREAILRLLLLGRPVGPDLDLAGLARRTSGFSGADLQNLVETAADEAIAASIERGEELPVGSRELERALAEVKPTTLEWLTTARNYARYANEAGQYDEVLRFLDRHARS